MNLTVTILNQTIIMMFLILGGVLCYKTKIITHAGSKELSKLILTIVNPVMIFIAYQREFDPELVKGLLWAFILGAISFGIAIGISYLMKNKDEDVRSVERFSVVYSNCAFMGMPLIKALFDYEGVFYLTAFLTIFNLLVWTHGVIQISGVKDLRSITKAFRSPSVIMILLGLVFFFLQIPLPDILMTALEYIGDLNTPLAMIVAGVTIAQSDIKKVFVNKRIYIISFVKLMLIPVIISAVFMLFPMVSVPVKLTVIIATAAPSATMCTLFCINYDKDSLYASEIFAMTTILSCLTLPLIMLIANLMM